MKNFLTGRINRLDLLKAFILLVILGIVVNIIAYIIIPTIVGVAELIVDLIIAIISTSLFARRLHDFGKSASLAFFVAFVPTILGIILYSANPPSASSFVTLIQAVDIVLLVITIYIFFKKGDQGNNVYGPIPQKRNALKILLNR